MRWRGWPNAHHKNQNRPSQCLTTLCLIRGHDYRFIRLHTDMLRTSLSCSYLPLSTWLVDQVAVLMKPSSGFSKSALYELSTFVFLRLLEGLAYLNYWSERSYKLIAHFISFTRVDYIKSSVLCYQNWLNGCPAIRWLAEQRRLASWLAEQRRLASWQAEWQRLAD